MNSIFDSARLIPYAKDHDRLQLALLYIEAECERYKKTESNVTLDELRSKEGMIRQNLKDISRTREEKIKQYIHQRHPAKYIDSTGQVVNANPENQSIQNNIEPKEWRDQETHRIFEMERATINTLADITKQISDIEDKASIMTFASSRSAKIEKLSECTAQKEEILKLIEELHVTAFDGATPEFPHEDQLEALVEVAEIALQGEQAVFDSHKCREDEMVALEEIAHSAERALEDLSSAVNVMSGKYRRERPMMRTIFILKELWRLSIQGLSETATTRCRALKEGVDNHFLKHPETILPPRIQTQISLVESKDLISIFFRAPPGHCPAPLDNVKQTKSAIETTIRTIRRNKEQAKTPVTKAKTMLELRRRQLAAARSQILDHVIDPENCPLEQRADRLPDYPEQISIHGLSRSHPQVSRLLTESETYPVEDYVKDIINSRLNRVRRATYPPIPLPGRYQPPTYDELKDPELLRRRYQRQVPPVEGDAPEYSVKPDYAGDIQIKAMDVRPRVEEELKELISKAREQLWSKSQEERDQLNEVMAVVMSIMMPGVRF